jgi:hypothetical protein
VGDITVSGEAEMNKQRNREPFFARLLDDQGSGSGIETKKYPSDAEDNPWADSPMTGGPRTEARKSPADTGEPGAS